MRATSVYRCPVCKKPYKTLSGWCAHMNLDHPDNRPSGYTDQQYFYYSMTGKSHGNCVVCKAPTKWNEETGKYSRFCDNPKCKEIYRDQFKKRMIKKYGKVTLLDDPDQQVKMLKNRKISGLYEFEDGGSVDYVGSYEHDFLKMMDKFMHYKSSDIMGPSPHRYMYEYEGGQHFYIPDFYIPDLNLEIEIKDDTTTHPKIRSVDKVKESKKDDVLNSIQSINYIKISDKKYEGFFKLLLDLKNSIREADMKVSPEEKRALSLESTWIKSILSSSTKSAMESENDDFNLDSASGNGYSDIINDHKVNDVDQEFMDLLAGFSSLSPYNQKVRARQIVKIVHDKRLDIDLNNYPQVMKYVYVPDYYQHGQKSDPVELHEEPEIAKNNGAQESDVNSGLSIFDAISAEDGEKKIPYNVDAHVKVETADPEDDFNYGVDHKEIYDHTLRMIDRFNTYAALNKMAKAHEIQSNILNYNLDIDLSAYPHISKFLSTPLGNTPMESQIWYSGNIFTVNGPAINIDDATVESFGDAVKDGLHAVYIILIRGKSVLGKTIRSVTKDRYSHAAISFDSKLDEIYSFGQNQMKGMKLGFQYTKRGDELYDVVNNHLPYAIYCTFVDDAGCKEMKKKLKVFTSNPSKYKYDWAGLVDILFKKGTERDDARFCSGFVVDILQAGNVHTNRSYSLYKPQDIINIFGMYKLIEGDDLNELDTNVLRIRTDEARKKYKKRMKK